MTLKNNNLRLKLEMSAVAILSLLAISPLLLMLIFLLDLNHEYAPDHLASNLTNHPEFLWPWKNLAESSEEHRFLAVRKIIEDPSLIMRNETDEILPHTLIGLDPDGKLSARLIREVIIPAVKDRNTSHNAFFLMGIKWPSLLRHHNNQTTFAELYAVVVEAALIAENRSDKQGLLSTALTLLKENLDEQSARLAARVFIAHMDQPEANSDVEELGGYLADISSELNRADLLPAVNILITRMARPELAPEKVIQLSGILTILKARSQPPGQALSEQDVQPAMAILKGRIEQPDSTFNDASMMAIMLANLGLNPRSNEAHDISLSLIERAAVTEAKPLELDRVGEILFKFKDSLEPKDFKNFASLLLARMTRPDTNPKDFTAIGYALASIRRALPAQDIVPGVRAVMDRIQRPESKSLVPNNLYNVLIALMDQLDSAQVSPFVAALLGRMNQPDIRFSELRDTNNVLQRLKNKLDGYPVMPPATELLDRITRYPNTPGEMESLLDTLKLLADKMDKQRISIFITPLIERLKIADAKTGELARTGSVLNALQAKLDNPQRISAATALMDRMGNPRTGTDELVDLANILAGIKPMLKNMDFSLATHTIEARLLLADLAPDQRSGLGKALTRLGGKLSPPAAGALARNMGNPRAGNNTAASIGETLSALRPRSSGQEAPAETGANALIERIRQPGTDSLEMVRMGLALAKLANTAGNIDVTPAVNAMTERMDRREAGIGEVIQLGNALAAFQKSASSAAHISAAESLMRRIYRPDTTQKEVQALTQAWLAVEPWIYAGNPGNLTERALKTRLAHHVELLRHPFAIGPTQNKLLDALQSQTGERFDGLQAFLDWAQSDNAPQWVPELGCLSVPALDGVQGEQFVMDY